MEATVFSPWMPMAQLLNVLLLCGVGYLLFLLVKVLRKYLRAPLSARRRRRHAVPWESTSENTARPAG